MFEKLRSNSWVHFFKCAMGLIRTNKSPHYYSTFYILPPNFVKHCYVPLSNILKHFTTFCLLISSNNVKNIVCFSHKQLFGSPPMHKSFLSQFLSIWQTWMCQKLVKCTYISIGWKKPFGKSFPWTFLIVTSISLVSDIWNCTVWMYSFLGLNGSLVAFTLKIDTFRYGQKKNVGY